MRAFAATIFVLFEFGCSRAWAGDVTDFAEKLRVAHHLPELGYAVVSSDQVLVLEVLGTRKMGAKLPARVSDRFRIGSNTKAVTALIAASLVQAGTIDWSTRYFSLFPSLEKTSDPAYAGVTLEALLSFRTRLARYTYTDAHPTPAELAAATPALQRRKFVDYFFRVAPTAEANSHSNPAFAAVGQMLEQASGKSYAQLVDELNHRFGLEFELGEPNASDATQTWGHTGTVPVPRALNPRLEWLQSAGNLNATLPGFARFAQLQLQGLHGQVAALPKETFEHLHYGVADFALGWFWERSGESGHRISHNLGNPGAYLSSVTIDNEGDRAFIIVSNSQSDEGVEALNELLAELQRRY